jgi:hypothetical protein
MLTVTIILGVLQFIFLIVLIIRIIKINAGLLILLLIPLVSLILIKWEETKVWIILMYVNIILYYLLSNFIK